MEVNYKRPIEIAKVEKKIEIIESMGINWKGDCPSEYGLLEFCGGFENRNYSCETCWIKALEE